MEIIRVHWLKFNSARKIAEVRVGDGFGSTIELGLFVDDDCRSLAQHLREVASDLDPEEDN